MYPKGVWHYMEKERIKCPECGYRMPIVKGDKAKATDLWVKCKNPKCRKEFEIKI